MKLELKHLAPYLPYGLDVVVTGINNHIKLKGLTGINGVVCDQGNTILNNVKPILRPLSDLTKEEYLIFDESPKWYLEDDSFKDVHYKDTLNNLIESIKDIGCYSLRQFNFLFENHLDVFGLIEKGLAIDINTLK